MLIRPVEADDFEQLGELMRQLNPDDPAFDNRNFQVFQEILPDPHFIVLVVEQDARLIGSLYLNIIPNLSRGGRPYALVENVIIDQGSRRQGIGKALMEKAIALAWEVGCYKLMLLTGRKGPEVHAFYKKLGFSAESKQAYILRAADSPPGNP